MRTETLRTTDRPAVLQDDREPCPEEPAGSVRSTDRSRGAEEFREQLTLHVRAWARHGIQFGASSWVCPAWRGVLYRRPYRTGAEFAVRSLEEYAGYFPTVCAGPGVPPGLSELRLPQRFGFTVVLADDPMTYRFPYGYRDAAKRGELNRHFLDAAELEERCFPLIRPMGTWVHAVLLRIAPVYATERYPLRTFLDRLASCLDVLPRTYRYAVEVGNAGYLHPEYFACLKDRNVAHVLSNRSGLPSVLDQIQMPHALTADFAVLRSSAASEATDSPPSGTCAMPDGEASLGILETVRRCIDEKRTLYAYVDDDGVHRIPVTIAALMTMLDGDLAKLSPVKQRAA